jgi:putative membrane protein
VGKFLLLLGGTIALRPYVFIFLGVYLLLATLQWGAGRAAAFLILGYLLSWAAEFCSIHFGLPFGEYLYIPATLDRELWVAGVPLMDSLSYVFIAYASYCLALLALGRGRWQGWGFYLEDEAALQLSRRPLILGAALMAAWTSSSIRRPCGATAGSWVKSTATRKAASILASP